MGTPSFGSSINGTERKCKRAAQAWRPSVGQCGKGLLLGQVLADVDGDSQDDDQALNDVGVRGVDVHELQRDLHQLKDQHADQDAGDGAHAAGGGNAADGGSRDGVQLVALGGVDRCAAGLGSQQAAGQAEHAGSQDVDADLGGSDVDAGDLSSGLVAADGVHVLAVAGLVVQEPEENGHDDGDPDQDGDAEEVVDGDGGEARVQGADGGTAGVDQADTVHHLLHAQGGDEGLHPQVRDDQAVAQADHRADGHDQQEDHDGGQGGQAGIELVGRIRVLRKDAGQAGGKASQTAGRQVVAGGDQTARDAQRDDVADGHVFEQVDDVGRAEEVGMDDADDEGYKDHQHNDGVIAKPALDDLAGRFLGSFHD